MPHNIDWYIKNRVFFLRLWGKVSVEEVEQQNTNILRFLNEGKPLIHVLVDDREVIEAPKSIKSMLTLADSLRHPSAGWVLAIGDTNVLVKFSVYLLMQSFRVRYRRFKTVDEALEFLRGQDQTLNWDEITPLVLVEEQVHMPEDK